MTFTNGFRNSALWRWAPPVGLVLLLLPGRVAADQVIPDDLIVQGSLCVGLDCVNNENFGFDTIRLKENNLRIHFDDTSTSAGFPANDWRLIANDSASGGSSKFSIEDSTGSKTPFTVTAGAATNSIFVDSTGRVGLRTGTPVLDLHINTSNTPAMRLEQNNSGGFTAQTWDVAGNEANFFVRDVTGGSRLPFRIRPGAPTSSLDITSDGTIGIGTASTDDNSQMHILTSLTNGLLVKGATPGTAALFVRVENDNGVFRAGVQGNGDTQFGGLNADDNLNLIAGGATRVFVNTTGQISFGSVPPAITTHALVHQSGAHLTSGGVWTSVSSRAAKQDIEPITSEQARDTVRALQPVGYRYKSELDERYVGFIAEDVPELVATHDRKGLAPMDITAVLTKVVQDQDQLLDAERKLNAEQRQELNKQQQLIAQQQKLLESLSQRLLVLEQKNAAVTQPVAVPANSK
ncbi:MAG: tail fiber domain-containing protein [Planctomycetota bacterium]